jgi:hypothetical protein
VTNIREKLCETYGDDLLFMDGPEFDEAILGVAEQHGSEAAVAYDVGRVLEILERDMSPDEAREYFDFNIGCAYVGKKTPVYINALE